MLARLSGTLEAGNDAVYEHCCTPCARDNLNTEATHYCKDCSQLFCDLCLKHHNRLLNGHHVLGKDDCVKWGNVKAVTATVMCEDHPGKELDLYCEDHGFLGCHICINLYHRACKQVKHVPDVAKGIQQREEFKSLPFKAANTLSRIKSIQDQRQNNLQVLKLTCEDIKSNIRDIRKSFEETIKQLEKDTLDELERLQSITEEGIQSDIAATSEMVNKIQGLVDQIQQIGDTCETFAFQTSKKCYQHLLHTEKLLATMQPSDYQLRFRPEVQIQKIISSLNTLGEIQVSPGLPAFAADHVFTCETKPLYDNKDRSNYWVIAMCQLPDGRTAIADSEMDYAVYLLNSSTFSRIDQLKVTSPPLAVRDICHTTGTEIAVSVSQKAWTENDCRATKGEIHFINADNNSLSPTRSVKLKHCCYGIAYCDNQLYIGTKTSVYVYTMTGQQIKILYEDRSDTKTTVSKFCPSADGSKIHILNPHRNLLITLDKTGHKLSELTAPDLKWPADVCTADNGAMFVCGKFSNTVLQVGSDGREKMATLATNTDGVMGPKTLCFNPKTRQLLLGMFANILVFYLK